MKKITYLYLIILLVCTTIVNQTTYANGTGLSETKQIVTDPRIELISIVMLLTDEGNAGLNDYDTQYRNDVVNHFEEFSDHRAVSICRDLLQSTFNYDAPIVYSLYHTCPPQFIKELEYPEKLIKRAASREILEEFADELADFALKSNFNEFYDEHHDYYQSLIDNVNEIIDGKFSYREILEDFYGESKYSYQIILAPLLKGGYGPQIITNNKKDVFCIMGPQSKEFIQNDKFGDITWFTYVTFHEFSHSFVNPVTERNESVLEKYDQLFTAISDTMRNQAYSSWLTCINEHLVRANVIRIMARIFNDSSYFLEQMLLNQERDRGFVYISDLNRLMKEYENERTKYYTYEDIYPEIIKYFQSKFELLESDNMQ